MGANRRLSGADERALHAVESRIEAFVRPAPMLVPLAEEGWTEGEVPRLVARRYLEPVIAAGEPDLRHRKADMRNRIDSAELLRHRQPLRMHGQRLVELAARKQDVGDLALRDRTLPSTAR